MISSPHPENTLFIGNSLTFDIRQQQESGH
jgi:hypothetical protein